MNLYEVSFTYTYRNGSQYTETLAKPLNVNQLVDACLEAENRRKTESNVVNVEVSTKKVGGKS